jgi:PAS domain S-box-containing protein
MTQTPDPYQIEQNDPYTSQHEARASSDQIRLSKLSMEISIALIKEDTLQGMLTDCTEVLVRHLNAAFARIWILNEEENILELQASSGIYTHLNGAHARVPVGAFKIGLIASERQPHLTNEVIGDPRVGNQEWARHEGMVAFAGYPLLIGERLIGVMALFARYPLYDAALQAMATIANGIALGIERKRIQEERSRLLIREQAERINAELTQERLAMAQRVGRIGTFEWDIQHNHILWTPELEALYGLPAGGFEGKYENWVQRVHPDDLQTAEENLSAAVAGGPPYNIEFRVLWPDATEHWLLGKGEITSYDEQGRPLRMIGVNIDISERKKAELQLALMYQNLQDLNATLEAKVEQRTEVLHQLNTELQRSNQELQDFAYVASHDLQEPLRKIQAFGNLLEEEYGQDLGGGKAYIDRMRNAATRMRILIDDLLTFSRITTKAAPFTQIDLNAVVRQVIDDVEPRLQATHGYIEAQSLPIIEADFGQMHQMFQNLIVNALKFHRPDVPPMVRVFAETREIPSVELATNSQPVPQYCLIFIEDNGIGFDEKYLDRIFTVFQRLHGKSDYEGTGIGLAVVRKIVERHDGTITAKSSVGKGTTFIITLPVAQQKTKEAAI